MFCSSCGVSVAQGLSYCNQCGAKLKGEKGDNSIKSSEVRPESLVWGMVAVLVFGFVAIVFLMMAMNMVGFNIGMILAFTFLSFLLMLLVEGVFIKMLLRGKRGAEETRETAPANEHATKELYGAEGRGLPEPRASVTDQTTRTLEPIYVDRKAK